RIKRRERCHYLHAISRSRGRSEGPLLLSFASGRTQVLSSIVGTCRGQIRRGVLPRSWRSHLPLSIAVGKRRTFARTVDGDSRRSGSRRSRRDDGKLASNGSRGWLGRDARRGGGAPRLAPSRSCYRAQSRTLSDPRA